MQLALAVQGATTTPQQTSSYSACNNTQVRPTAMNPSSSRGHTLFIVRFSKFDNHGGKWIPAFRSKLNFVDLAGSERPKDTGLTGVGLEEGVSINKSLASLGQVIHDLAVDGTSLHMRESRLTQCLTESLNGKAITILIAAISPAALNYGDTISTLRFADNAKRLKVPSPTAAANPCASSPCCVRLSACLLRVISRGALCWRRA